MFCFNRKKNTQFIDKRQYFTGVHFPLTKNPLLIELLFSDVNSVLLHDFINYYVRRL